MESLQQVQDRLAALETLSGLLRSKTGGNDTLTCRGTSLTRSGTGGPTSLAGLAAVAAS